jgi:hypothetical protein
MNTLIIPAASGDPSLLAFCRARMDSIVMLRYARRMMLLVVFASVTALHLTRRL